MLDRRLQLCTARRVSLFGFASLGLPDVTSRQRGQAVVYDGLLVQVPQERHLPVLECLRHDTGRLGPGRSLSVALELERAVCFQGTCFSVECTDCRDRIV